MKHLLPLSVVTYRSTDDGRVSSLILMVDFQHLYNEWLKKIYTVLVNAM